MKSIHYPKNIIISTLFAFSLLFCCHSAIAQECTATATGSSIRCGGAGVANAAKINTTAPTSYAPVENLFPMPVDISLVAINAIPLLRDQANIDDTTTPALNIGFPFVFYGNTYSTAIIQTNGIVGFSNNVPPNFLPFNNGNNTDYYESYNPVPIPNTTVPNNYIAGMFADIDLAAGGTLTYASIGTIPNRKFVVEFKNVKPFRGAGATGTASFQIILNENGTFEVIIIQLSANWNVTSNGPGRGGFMTCGAENIDGTIANTVPGRNNEDWITNGVDITTPNSWIFSAVTWTFVNWTDPVTSNEVSRIKAYTVIPKPTVTTSYRANWASGTKSCSKDATVIVTPPTLKELVVTNSTDCSTTGNGSVTFTTNLPNGTYTLNYNFNGVPTSSTITVVITGAFPLTGLAPGLYTGFSLPSFAIPPGCTLILPADFEIKKELPTPTVDAVPIINCPNKTLVLTNSEAIVAGTTINWYSAPNGGGTLLGTGATLSVAPKVTTSYYVRRESASCGISADKEVVVTVRRFIYAADGATSSNYCTGNNDWNHYFNASDEIIFSIQGNLGAGVTQATINVSNGGLVYENAINCVTTPTDKKFELARSWNFNWNAPPGTYAVRFYYNPNEKTELENAVTAWKAANSTCNYGNKYTSSVAPDFATAGFYWFKNTGGDYTQSYDGLHLSSAISNTETGGTANYVELTGITSFSGGSGGVILTPPVVPLPVTLVSFSGKRLNTNQVKLTWETVAEVNNAGFEVEFAANARDFEKIAFQPAQGNTKTIATYQQNINNIIGGYFRLKQLDKDKKYNYSKIIYIDGTNEATIRIYPNPTKDNLTIDLGEFKATDEVKVSFRNMLGVIVTELSLSKVQTEISLGNLPKGIYVAQVVRNGKMIVEKIVLQ